MPAKSNRAGRDKPKGKARAYLWSIELQPWRIPLPGSTCLVFDMSLV